ncbi:MAG: patatin-like phospholipase family protein [Burkholderiales bacterium]|nr:patatin-like phospholipase family protein [Burkholderiales bacterium]
MFAYPRRSVARVLAPAHCAALGLALLFQASAWGGATAATPGAAPRIGLALSGGGARGLAHIGVLKVLEELRVPVHCVTGTSMGAIVGGAYASGNPADRLEKMVRGADWNDVFRDQPERREISSRRKVDDYKTLFAPEWGVKNGGLALPKGVIAGVSIEAFFRVMTEQAVGVRDFAKLPIPYRAIAADIETGEAVVLATGSVPHAMRASMSVPGAIAPVEIGGRLLVDGGIANNLPIDEARKLCADVVIAVNISTPPLKRSEITSALSVSAQLLNFLGKATVDEQLRNLRASDVLIAPDLGDISAGSFERSADAIRIGEEATRKLADRLRRYSLPPGEYATLRSRQTLARTGLGKVDEIRFEGLTRTNPEVLRSLVQLKPGEELTEEKIGEDLRRIYGRGDFESVDYRIDHGPAGRVMVITPREKEWGPDYLRFGLGLATDFQGENIFNLLLQYRKTWMNRLGGEWLTEAQVGQSSYLHTEFFQPVHERGRYFVSPYARIGRTSRGVFFGENRIAEYDVADARVGIDGGATLGTLGEARLGAIWRRVDASLDTGSAGLPEGRETTAGPRALAIVDQLDHAWFARSGFRAVGSAYFAEKSFGSDRGYQRLEGSITGAKSWGAHTVNLTLAAGTDLHSGMPAYEAFSLGGPLRLSAYRIGEFSGQRFGYGRAMYYNRALPLPDILGTGVYVGGAVEAAQMHGRFDGLPFGGTIWSGSVFLGANTFAGPAYFGAGVGEAGRFSLYLLLGAP